MLGIRTQLIVPYSCKFAIVPLFLSRYIYRLWPSRCTIMQKGSKKWDEVETTEDFGLYCKKMTCFLNDYAVQWWRCWLYDESWGLVVYCIIGFGCSEKNKRLQCKAKTHISERPYFYKKTVYVSLFSPCGLLLVRIMTILNNNYNYTLKQKNTYKWVFLLLLYFRAMHTKSPKCQVVRVRWWIT